jgi:hypothetical protein
MHRLYYGKNVAAGCVKIICVTQIVLVGCPNSRMKLNLVTPRVAGGSYCKRQMFVQ